MYFIIQNNHSISSSLGLVIGWLNLIGDIFIMIVCMIMIVLASIVECKNLANKFGDHDDEDTIFKLCNAAGNSTPSEKMKLQP